MRLGTNITALTIATTMKKVDRHAAASSLRLSSGKKINYAKDDPSGYSIASKLDASMRVSYKAQENYSDGMSLTQTIDGALSSATDMLQRARVLANQAASDTLSNEDRAKMQLEIEQIKEELDSLSKSSAFNGINYLSGESARLSYPSDPSTVSYDYVSGNVPEGILKYDIDEYGEPAQVSFPELTPPEGTAGSEGSISINGYKIEYTETETYEEINNKIKEACYATNIEYTADGGTVKLTTLDEGSKESIDISVTGGIGIPNSSDEGKDAVISNLGLYQRPDGTEPIESFNSSAGITIDGNDISIKSSNNQEIDISLGFKVGTDGTFLDGKGNPISSFGGMSEESTLLDAGQLKIQGGSDKNNSVDLYLRRIDSETLGVEYLNISTQQGASEALTQIDDALGELLSYRAQIGAYENRLSSANDILDTTTLNMETHLSTIEDTDVAFEMSYQANQQVKLQAALSVLAQANQRPQQILQLLG